MESLTTEQFDNLYRTYYKPLFYQAYGFVEDAELCRDILSDVFERLWTNRSRIAPDTAAGYLYQCVRNESIDQVRRKNLSRQYQDFVKASASTSAATIEEEDERLVAIRHTINEMPEKTQQVLEQCYFNNKKYREVAEMMDISTSTVKKHIVKALALLRDKCGQPAPGHRLSSP